MAVQMNFERDKLFDELGLMRLRESYMRSSEKSPQERFAFVAETFYERMAQDYEGRLVFASADSDACPNLKKELGVQHIPTMVIFKNGKPLDGRLVEVKTPSELKAFIDAGLAA